MFFPVQPQDWRHDSLHFNIFPLRKREMVIVEIWETIHFLSTLTLSARSAVMHLMSRALWCNSQKLERSGMCGTTGTINTTIQWWCHSYGIRSSCWGFQKCWIWHHVKLGGETERWYESDRGPKHWAWYRNAAVLYFNDSLSFVHLLAFPNTLSSSVLRYTKTWIWSFLSCPKLNMN